MHGRPRKAPKPEDAAASAAKASKLRSLQSQFLHYHHNKNYTKEAVELSAKLLDENPEFYTAWNYRKLAVHHNQSQSDPDSLKSLLDEELRVVESALRRNFKSYGAWHHRKWVLSKGHSSVDHELRLLDKLQKADPRNFHAWSYRRFVAALMNRSEEEELKHTEDMLYANFSNYSAWHNRSVLLSHLLRKRVQGFFSKEKVLANEFEFVHNAIFTDDDDQSGWFYHLWLLNQTVKPDVPLLLSSWPTHGSHLTVSVDRCLDSCAFSPLISLLSDTGAFPLILYFNEAVKGVNSSTVTVESVFNSNKDLLWRPLSTNNSGTAQAWAAHLNFHNIKPNSLEAYQVKVSLGHSQGIISSNGSPFTQPSQFAFEVRVWPPKSEYSEIQGVEKVLWKDENFHIYEACSEESSPIDVFDQLKIKDDPKGTPFKWHIPTITDEMTLFQDLSACKIGKLTLARLLMAHDMMMLYNTTCVSKEVPSEKVLKLYSDLPTKEELYYDLMKLDPSHSQYYKDELSLVLLWQVASSRESLLKHCCHYRDSTSTNVGNPVCLRLNNLSLSRIGSVEQLLWVQMLDLSHNELLSIEGLGAMQLLSCLNLGYNKLGSFTALEPLRLMKSLKVLDISYNELGAHTIDTTRYLCSSPLSHAAGCDWSFDGIAGDDIKVTNYWEAFLIFKGLNLTQLDVVGNAITDEKFKSFLVRVLPTLKWLDSEELC